MKIYTGDKKTPDGCYLIVLELNSEGEKIKLKVSFIL